MTKEARIRRTITGIPEVRDISSFLKTLKKVDHGGFIFRGQPKDWPLIPSIARYDCRKCGYDSWSDFQEGVLDEFIKFGHPYVDQGNCDRIDWLIHARHHGLPTRLLDCSQNPLKALFFSVAEQKYDKDEGVFFAFTPVYWREAFTGNMKLANDEMDFYLPRQINSRLIAQESCFIVFPTPENTTKLPPIDKGTYPDSILHITKVRIPRQYKKRLRLELSQLGVRYRSLFPDLSGVASDVVSHLGEVCPPISVS